MTYSPTIYDWRPEVAPLNMLFRAGGTAVSGGMTLSGAAVTSPEPGGRGELQMEFSPFATTEANIAASWTISRIMNGAVMRIPLPHRHVQLVTDADLGIDTDAGVEWDNNLPWDGGVTWRRDAYAEVLGAASAGEIGLRIDMSVIGDVLRIGHVIGLYLDGHHFPHVVMNAYKSPGLANFRIEVSPPLRRDVAAGNNVRFRPIFQGSCINAREVAGLYRYGAHVELNAARFVEAMV